MRTLRLRLLVAYLLPTLALFGLFAFFADRIARQHLDLSLGKRLADVAQTVAGEIRPSVIEFLSVGDDQTRSALRLKQRLIHAKESVSARRIFIFDLALRSRSDSDPTVNIGDPYYQVHADRTELEAVFRGETMSSVLFKGEDQQHYKRGYAPIRQGAKVIAVLAVEGSARYFEDLTRLHNYFLVGGGVIASIILLVSLFVAKRITDPIRELARAAEDIGQGQLDQPIAVQSRSEVGLLATTMNRMRKDLHERDQQMQLMLSGIAHEVRNPLGGIELFAGLLRDELAEQPENLELLQRIEQELSYLKRVVNDFLQFARYAPPTLDRLDLRPLLSAVSELVAKEAAKKGVTIVNEGEPTLALADAGQIRGVLLNLVRNGVQATPVGGRVRLSCSGDETNAWISVADTGPGIDEAIREKVTDPFFTTREKGTGLGLALAKKVVDNHGGTLTIESEQGQGCTVRVKLRAAQG
jgi:signal transduction histidine kinase